jgi:hypothetical protein
MRSKLVVTAALAVLILSSTSICFGEEMNVQISTSSPISSVNLERSNEAEKKFYYDLQGSRFVGTQIAVGDRLIFRSNGLAGGMVEGDAALDDYGAWKVVFNTEGAVIFEATKTVHFDKLLRGFVVIGKDNFVMGTINYQCVGNWIGSAGKVLGPALVEENTKTP